MAEKLTPTQVKVLQGVRDHGEPSWFARGLSQHGGFTGATRALVRRGLLAGPRELTDAGREALAAAERPR